MNRLRRWTRALARTPFHPQWLLGPRRPPAGIGSRTGTVLDIGSADEWIRPHLHPSAHYVSLDFPATGQALYAARPCVFGDAARLPFADASLDAVVCLEVIEHVPHPERVLAEIGRTLKPGGHAYLSMPFLYPVHDAPYDFSRLTEFGWR